MARISSRIYVQPFKEKYTLFLRIITGTIISSEIVSEWLRVFSKKTPVDSILVKSMLQRNY